MIDINIKLNYFFNTPRCKLSDFQLIKTNNLILNRNK